MFCQHPWICGWLTGWIASRIKISDHWSVWVFLICFMFLNPSLGYIRRCREQKKKTIQVVRSNTHWGLIEGQTFLTLPLEHVLLAQALVLIVFPFLPSAYFEGHDEKMQWEIYCCIVCSDISRIHTTTLCSVLFRRAHGRNLSQVLGKAAFLLNSCGMFVLWIL